MIERELAELLAQMRLASSDACLFVEGFDKADFLADLRTRRAVMMSLLIIGETAGKIMDLYPDTVKNNSAIPWQSARGMRNRIAHAYFGLDMDMVWETVTSALPDLIAKLDRLV